VPCLHMQTLSFPIPLTTPARRLIHTMPLPHRHTQPKPLAIRSANDSPPSAAHSPSSPNQDAESTTISTCVCVCVCNTSARLEAFVSIGSKPASTQTPFTLEYCAARSRQINASSKPVACTPLLRALPALGALRCREARRGV